MMSAGSPSSFLTRLLETDSSESVVLATTHENERPLQGLAGELDWIFQGELSQFLKTHRMTGSPGECTYLPVSRHGRTFHLLLLGCGPAEEPGHRTPPPHELLKTVKKNLKGLKAKKVLLSATDMGGMSESQLQKELGDLSIWIGP